jgi:hypothetical protein
VAAAGYILALVSTHSTYLIANLTSSYHVCSGCTAVEMHRSVDTNSGSISE